MQWQGINTLQVLVNKVLIGYLEVQQKRPQRLIKRLWVNLGCSSELGEEEEKKGNSCCCNLTFYRKAGVKVSSSRQTYIFCVKLIWENNFKNAFKDYNYFFLNLSAFTLGKVPSAWIILFHCISYGAYLNWLSLCLFGIKKALRISRTCLLSGSLGGCIWFL